MNGYAVTLVLLVVAFAVARSAGRRRASRRTRALAARLESARVPAASLPIDVRALDELPAPVARYLRQALPAGARRMRAVTFAHRGELDLGTDRPRWRPFESYQRVIVCRPGFVWSARVSMLPGLPVYVHDALVEGEGLLAPSLLGLIDLDACRDRGELARGELMRFVAEAVWYPTAFLPGEGARWTAIDERHAQLSFADGALEVSLRFGFGSDGWVESIAAGDRPRRIGQAFVPTSWEIRLGRYEQRCGMQVPLEGEVAWCLPDGRRPYWRGELVEMIGED